MGEIKLDKEVRQSNIELLRIIAMLMIVAHHVSMHSGFEFPIEKITINRLWVQFIQIGGKIGVDIFVLISGYFLIMAPKIKIGKLLKFYLQVYTYSILSFSIFIVLGRKPFGMNILKRHLLPLTFDLWWFASAYFMLYLISPFLNKLLKSLDKKDYQKMLVVLSICWSVFPTFVGRSLQSNSLLWFLFLYAVAGYIRIYDIKNKVSGAKYIAISMGLIVLTFGSAVVFDLLGTRIPFFASHATVLYSMEAVPIVLISFFMFLGFLHHFTTFP